MKYAKERKKAIKCLEKIAFGKSNDAVKLILAEPAEMMAMAENLDLTMLSGIKRGPKGDIEVMLINRIDAIKLLLEVTEETDVKEESGAVQIIKAINGVSGTVGSGDEPED